MRQLQVIATLVLLAATLVEAAPIVVFQSGFEASEGYSLAAPLLATNTQPNPHVGIPYWSYLYNPPEDALVQNTVVASGTQAGKWYGGYTQAGNSSDIAIVNDLVDTDKALPLLFSTKAYHPTTNVGNNTLVFALNGLNLAVYFGRGSYYTGMSGDADKVKYVVKAGTSSYYYSDLLTMNAWHQIDVKVNWNAGVGEPDTLDVVVDGTPVVTGVDFTGATQLTEFNVWPDDLDDDANDTFYVDDIFLGQVVPIPEPATLALLALGGTGLIGWMARRRSPRWPE